MPENAIPRPERQPAATEPQVLGDLGDARDPRTSRPRSPVSPLAI